MKNKNILIALGLVVSVALIALIMREMTPMDEEVPDGPTAVFNTDVVDEDGVDVPPIETDKVEVDKVEVPPIEPTKTETDDVGDDEGTEQTIQPEPEKQEYTEEELSDPTQTPDGQEVEQTPTEPNEPEPEPEPEPQEEVLNPTAPPGFENAPNLGPSVGTVVDGPGDINKQVGYMG